MNSNNPHHKIFISYKYKDTNVRKITSSSTPDTARDYVNYLSNLLSKKYDHIYKGEDDDQPLNHLSEEALWETLKDRLFDTTMTIVLISPNMKENIPDMEQWIPWEISYSLKEETRANSSGLQVTSHINAMLAVVLPDVMDSYSYFINNHNCCSAKCSTYNFDIIFDILRENMFNIKDDNGKPCGHGVNIFYGEYSYIPVVIWSDFINNIDSTIERCYRIQNSVEKYDIKKELWFFLW